MYQKMLENPDNRKSSSGSMKQPTPYSDGKQGPGPTESGEPLNAEENAYLESIDQRMAARRKGEAITESETKPEVSRIVKLEEEVSELKELMVEMMKTHMKLLRK